MDNDARKYAMAMSEKVEEQLREQIKQIEKVSDYNADQLTKVKEIIKNLLILKKDHHGNTDIEWRVEVIEQAEQFLKEIEK